VDGERICILRSTLLDITPEVMSVDHRSRNQIVITRRNLDEDGSIIIENVSLLDFQSFIVEIRDG
jgi:hypothetical protein